MLAPEAITAQTMAPAEEPANGVVSCTRTNILLVNIDTYTEDNDYIPQGKNRKTKKIAK